MNYPAKFTVENLEPNQTYYVGIQGIGSPTASYTLSATFDSKPYNPPTELKVDDMPTNGQVCFQSESPFIGVPSVSHEQTFAFPHHLSLLHAL